MNLALSYHTVFLIRIGTYCDNRLLRISLKVIDKTLPWGQFDLRKM